MLSYFHCFSVLVWKARRAKDIRIRHMWTRFVVFEHDTEINIFVFKSVRNHNCFLQQYGILSRYPTEIL